MFAGRDALMLLGRSMKEVLRRYADFSGRTRRSDYWAFVAGFALLLLLAWTVDLALRSDDRVRGALSLALLLPLFAVTTRRLHDTGRSGWRQLLWLVPFGFIFLVVWTVEAGTGRPNQYGLADSASGGGPAAAAATMGSWRSPSTQRVTHIDAEGRVVAMHMRAETCHICGTKGGG